MCKRRVGGILYFRASLAKHSIDTDSAFQYPSLLRVQSPAVTYSVVKVKNAPGSTSQAVANFDKVSSSILSTLPLIHNETVGRDTPILWAISSCDMRPNLSMIGCGLNFNISTV